MGRREPIAADGTKTTWSARRASTASPAAAPPPKLPTSARLMPGSARRAGDRRQHGQRRHRGGDGETRLETAGTRQHSQCDGRARDDPEQGRCQHERRAVDAAAEHPREPARPQHLAGERDGAGESRRRRPRARGAQRRRGPVPASRRHTVAGAAVREHPGRGGDGEVDGTGGEKASRVRRAPAAARKLVASAPAAPPRVFQA